MPIPIRFAEGPPGNAAVDFDHAWSVAVAAGDRAGQNILRRLLLEYVHLRLAEMRASRLAAFLRERQVWRSDGQREVFKAGGEPCVVFTALDFGAGAEIVVLGACYRYPVSEQDWWDNVIKVRLQAL